MSLSTLSACLALSLIGVIAVLQLYADLVGRSVIRQFIEEVNGPPLFASGLAGEARATLERGGRSRLRWLREMQPAMHAGMRRSARRALWADRLAWMALLLLLACYLIGNLAQS